MIIYPTDFITASVIIVGTVLCIASIIELVQIYISAQEKMILNNAKGKFLEVIKGLKDDIEKARQEQIKNNLNQN